MICDICDISAYISHLHFPLNAFLKAYSISTTEIDVGIYADTNITHIKSQKILSFKKLKQKLSF